MRRIADRRCAAPLAALALCACIAAPVTPGAPKTVRAHPVSPYAWHEECMELEPGDRVEFAFESSEPVDFNIHYHEGSAVVMPIVRDKTRADAGVYTASIAHGYCLMWEAGAAGASIDYRIRLRPRPP
jgi:hypothetical protein